MRDWLQRRWYADLPPPLALRPLAALFGRLAAARRRRQQAQAHPLPVPVIVVGNLSVGGTGKTPVVIWLVETLRACGLHPGVVSRGYGGRAPHYPFRVNAQASAAQCGDEPLLIARRCGVPVVVDADRNAAARALLAAQPEIDVIVSDDGLQHYRLHRDIEICVIDGSRGLGNAALLPAGPLREPAARLDEIPLVLVNGGDPAGFGARALRFDLLADECVALDGGARQPLRALAGRRVHAVAGIGHPARFFALLRAHGLQPLEHAYPDHHAYRADDLAFDEALPILMTEKDATKCAGWRLADAWTVPVQAQVDPRAGARLRALLEARPACAADIPR